MDRKFTLRISDSEDIALQEIKKLIGKDTDSSAIRYIITNYCKLYEDKKRGEEIQRELSRKLEIVQTFKESLSALQKL